MQALPQTTGLGSHHSAVEDSEAAPILKEEQMQAFPMGLMQQQWSTEYGSYPPQDNKVTPPKGILTPAGPHPFMQAAEFLEIENSSYDKLPPHLSYPPRQVELIHKASQLQETHALHTNGVYLRATIPPNPEQQALSMSLSKIKPA